jgi:hypothetical protein
MSAFCVPFLNVLKDLFGLDLWVGVVDLHEDLNRRILQCLHGNIIVDFGTLIHFVRRILPFKACLILLLFEGPFEGLSAITSPRNVVIWYNLELREERPFLLPIKGQLHLSQAYSHSLVLLDIQLKQDAAKRFPALDVPDFQVVALRAQGYRQKL